jgi:hypothetical protein
MKTIYLFLCIILCFCLNGQNPLTSAKIPVIGDIEIYKAADTTGIVQGPSGLNQNWNFSGIVFSPSTTVNTTTYVSPSTAPNFSLFPSANLASTNGVGYYGMHVTTTSSWNYIGDADPTPSNCNVYSNPYLILTYPFAYGASLTDTHASSGGGLNANGSSTITADGTGTVTLPGPTVFGNVLRCKQILKINYTGSFTATYDAVAYTWFSPVNKFPLMTIQNYTFASPAGTTIDKVVNVNYQLALAVANYDTAKEMFNIYPNPATDEINIKLRYPKGEERLLIYNALGEVCKEILITADNESAKLNIQDLKSGVYFVKLSSDKESKTEKLIIR